MSGQKSPSRTLLQLLISEPATTPDGRMNTWFAQFLQRLVSYVGAVPAGSNGQSLSEQLSSVITSQIEQIGGGGTSASSMAQIQALESLASLVPPLPAPMQQPVLAPLSSAAPWVSPPYPYSDLPAELTYLPIPIGCAGAVPANFQVVVPLTLALSLPANMVGTNGYALVAPTVTRSFVLSYIRAGVTTAIATLTFAAGSHTLSAISSAAIQLLATDVLLLTGPAVADATLASATITSLFQRV